MGGVVVVDALGGEDGEEADDAGPLLVLAAQLEQDVEDVRVRRPRFGDALVVVLVAQPQQLEQQLLLGPEVVQQARLAHADALGDGRQRRAAEAARGEDLVGRGEDRVAPLTPLRVPAPLTACGAHRAGA